jgi:uncharacterized protein YkwD
MNGKLSIIIIVILVTAAILTVQSSSSMLRPSYAQSCPDGSTPDASGNCPTEAPPAGDGETAQAPPATETIDDGSFPVTPPPATEAPPPATTETPPPATEAPPPATTETPPPATEAPPDDASQGATNTGGMSADWANSILAVHNSERAAVGVPPLVWSDSLAASAQTWAEHLLTIHEWVHSTNQPYGENLASFSWFWGPTSPNGGGTPYWVVEKSNYVPGTPIEHGTIGPNGGVYGHYTQMVWSTTTQIGCGVANDGGSSILVCHYYPPGNEVGKAPY